MKEKIIGIFVCMLLIATAIPALGTTPNLKVSDEKSVFSSHEIEIEWEYKYGGVNDEVIRYIKQTTDDGYIGVGVWDGTSHWLLKLDADGKEEWNVSVLPNATHWPRCYIVEQTSDGGYVTAGCHESGTWGYNRCIWKVDADGNTEWLKVYDDPLYGYHTCIQETNDGGYIVTGEIDIGTQDWDVLLMKTDSTGNLEWQKTYRYGEFGDNAYAVRQTSDDGYILCGRTEPEFGTADLLVIKTDSDGNIEWDKTYGGAGWEWSQSKDILILEDGYLFLGETASYGEGSRDVWLLKTDVNGNEEWNKTYGGKYWEMCGALDFTDGGYIISATENAQGMMVPKSEGLFIKTDENGNTIWQVTFGYDEYDQLQGACSTNDGGYIVAGNSDTTGSSGHGLIDGWVIKLKAFENNPPDKPDKPSGKKKITPGAVYTYKTSTSEPEDDQLYYCWDWGDNTTSGWLGPYNSTEVCEAEHYWDEDGNYTITVVAKDSYGRVGEVSDGLEVGKAKNKAYNFNFPIINWLLERFPNAFPILRYMKGL